MFQAFPQAFPQAVSRGADIVCLLCVASTVSSAPQTTQPSTAWSHEYTDSRVHEAASGGDWELPPVRSADWPGIEKDTWYFVGYQFAVVGALYVAPEDISQWSEEQKDDYSFARWRDNVANPHWDEDRWWINYVLHPYWGGAYYIRARERGLDRRQSFLYSALLSTLFEFGVEALFEAPSYQDLIVTPVAGYLVGHYLFTPLRMRILAQPGDPGWAGKTVLILTDPLGAANAQVDRIFGIKANVGVQLAPVVAHDRRSPRGQTGYPHNREPRDAGALQGWVLQMRITW